MQPFLVRAAMLSSDELLERAAADGSFDMYASHMFRDTCSVLTDNSAEWPRVLETVLARLEKNVFKEFSTPASPTRDGAQAVADAPNAGVISTPEPNAPDRENDGPPSSPPAAPSPIPSFPMPPSSENPLDGPSSSTTRTLPHQLQESYTYIINTILTHFPTQPPHTIQRLAELVLYPRQHYRYLPSYLNALDRTVSVSSGSALFPLPSLDPLSSSFVPTSMPNGTLSNGNTSSSSDSSASSSPLTSQPASQDDSLGGALLTPIPWLRANGGDGGDGGSNSSVSGRERSSSPLDADADGIATSSSPLSGASSPGHERASVSPSPIEPGEDNVTPGSGGITQGELPRQEQTASDPPAPVSSLPSRAHLAAASPEEAEALDVRRDIGDQGIPLQGDGVVNSAIEDRNRDEKHEQPHARGPDLIGMEDTGKQDPHSHGGGSGQVLDIEAAVGRASSKSGREHKETAESIEADPTAERSQKRKAEDGEGEGSDAQKMKQDNDGDVEIADASSAAATEKKSSDATGADTVDTIEQ